MSKSRDTQQSETFDAIAKQSLASLMRALHTDEQVPLTCAECREHFTALHHKLETATPLAELETAAAYHLATCATCMAEFEALQGAMLALTRDTLPELDQPYEFDLSFLTASPPPMPQPMPPVATTQAAVGPLWTHALTTRLWQLVSEVQIRLQAGRAAFAAVPAALTPTFTTGMVTRGEGDDNQLEVLVLPAADATFSVHLAVGPLIAGKAVVTVKLVNIDDAQPLCHTLVALRNSQRQLLLGCLSGEDGCAILEPLAQGRYFIQVQYNQQTWEVPLMIMGGSPLV